MKKVRKPSTTGSGLLAPPHSASDDANTLKPHFSFEHLVPTYNLTPCTVDERSNFALALQLRSSMTWTEIITAPREGLGSEKISSLKVTIPATVPSNKQGLIVAFRFGGRARFLGYRDGRVFYVLWIDPKGKTYDHE